MHVDILSNTTVCKKLPHADHSCLGESIQLYVPLFEQCLNIKNAKTIDETPIMRTPRQIPAWMHKSEAKIYHFFSN